MFHLYTMVSTRSIEVWLRFFILYHVYICPSTNWRATSKNRQTRNDVHIQGGKHRTGRSGFIEASGFVVSCYVRHNLSNGQNGVERKQETLMKSYLLMHYIFFWKARILMKSDLLKHYIFSERHGITRRVTFGSYVHEKETVLSPVLDRGDTISGSTVPTRQKSPSRRAYEKKCSVQSR